MSGASKTVLSAGTSLEPEVPKCDNLQDWTISREEIIDIAWLAGVIDGEGCIFLSYTPKKDVPNPTKSQSLNRYYVRLTVENTNPHIIQRISKIWERHNLKFSYAYTNRPKKRETLMIFTTGFGSLRKALEMVLPYLSAKKEEAECLLRFMDWREEVCSRYKSPAELPVRTQEVYEELKVLKRRYFNLQRLSRTASKALNLD